MADNNRLFDFSLLDSLEIVEVEKQFIKESSIKHILASDSTSYYGKSFNNFHVVNGYARFSRYMVYPDGCKRAYVVFEMVVIKHYSGTRKCVWDDFIVSEIIANGYPTRHEINSVA